MTKVLFMVFAACLMAVPAAAQGRPTESAQHYGNRADVREFIGEMVERHGFVERELKTLFARTTRQPEILKAIRPPAGPKKRSWLAYRATFVNDRHIAEGLRFYAQHAAALERAEREYGVPAEIIVAIIGVETFYGRNMGKWRVVDALAHLGGDEAEHPADDRSAPDRDRELREERHRARGRPAHESEDQREEYDGRAVVQQALGLDQGAEAMTDIQLLEERHNGDRVGRRDQGAEHEPVAPVE